MRIDRYSNKVSFRIGIVLLLLLSFFIVPAQETSKSFQEALASKEAELVFIYNDVAYLAYTATNGEVKGILIDVMNAFEKYLKQQYEISVSTRYKRIDQHNFQQFLEEVRHSSGGVFGLSNTSITDQRKQYYRFSRPYMNNISVLVSHAQVPVLESFDHLPVAFKQMTAYTVPGSTYQDRLNDLREKYFSEMTIEYVPSGQAVMQALNENENSFAIVDLLYYMECYKKGYAIKRHKLGDEPGDQFGIIMPGNSDWQAVLNEFLGAGFLKSMDYRMIVSDHVGKSALRLLDDEI